MKVIKRNGSEVIFDITKIIAATDRIMATITAKIFAFEVFTEYTNINSPPENNIFADGEFYYTLALINIIPLGVISIMPYSPLRAQPGFMI